MPHKASEQIKKLKQIYKTKLMTFYNKKQNFFKLFHYSYEVYV